MAPIGGVRYQETGEGLSVVDRGAEAGVATPANRAVADLLAVHADGADRMTERLTVRGVEPRLHQVPLRRALHTSASRITAAPLLLIDVLAGRG